jgi:succinyl-diaminopimelate desuccinylase
MDRADGVADTRLGPALRDALDVNGMIAACQDLVRIPSLSGEEAAAGSALAQLLRDLGYDRVEIDDKGNVLGRLGRLDGPGEGSVLLFNGHLDHVPPARWAIPTAAVWSTRRVGGNRGWRLPAAAHAT